MKRFVLTGGPSTGKTTTLKELEKKGFFIVPEASRDIIIEEQKKENGIVPWKDMSAFQKLFMKVQLEREANIPEDKNAFLDRGLPDSLAYCMASDAELPEEVMEAIKKCKYHKVFILEPLKSFEDDGVRKDKDIADKIHASIKHVYEKLGFEVVMVPEMSVEDRIKLILDRC